MTNWENLKVLRAEITTLGAAHQSNRRAQVEGTEILGCGKMPFLCGFGRLIWSPKTAELIAW